MEEKGLITRKPNPEDGRGVLIFLTDFGREKREYSLSVINMDSSISLYQRNEQVNVHLLALICLICINITL